MKAQSIKNFAREHGFDLRRSGSIYVMSYKGNEVGRFGDASSVREYIEHNEALAKGEDAEVADAKAEGVDPRRGMKYNRCSPEGACGRVWELAEEMIAEGYSRKEVIAAAVEEDIHPGTAATQFARWKQAVAESQA